MKRVAAVWVVLAIWMAAVPAAAAVSFEQVRWDESDGGVHISGTVSEGETAVSVVVLMPGYTAPDETNLKGSCAYLRTVRSGADGTFRTDAALPGPGAYPLVMTARGAQYRTVIRLAETAETVAVYIAPDGSDETGFGTEEAPFAGFDKALSAAQAALDLADVDIIFRGGAYQLQQPCVVTADQGGRNGRRLRVRAAAGETVRLRFTRTVTGWEEAGGGIWRAPLLQGEKPASLYEQGTLAVPARSPNRDGQENRYLHSANMDGAQPDRVFYTEAGQFPQPADSAGLQAFLWPGGKNGHYNWSTQLIAVSAFDAASGRVTLARAAAYEIGAGSRYYLQGVREFLDAPGEFYADTAAGFLYYYPYDPAALAGGVELPLGADGFRLEGTEARPVRDVAVEGLSIGGIDAPGRGVRMMNAKNCAVASCEIEGVGYHGITIEGVSSGNAVTGNRVRETGSDGIAVMGKTNVPEKVSYGNRIENNQVRRVGWRDGNAGGIRVYDSAENVIRHNQVSGAPRYGIHLKGITRDRIIGNTYGGVTVTEANFRDFQKTRDNLVEANDVSDVMRDSQDCGAIATWGVNTGNVIRGNWIHDCAVEPITVLPERTYVFGIYMDEDSDGVLVEDNIISGLSASGGAQVMGLVYPRGVGVTVQNNLFVNNGSNSVFLYNDTYDTSGGAYGCGELVFRHNASVNSGGVLYTFQDRWTTDKIAQADRNLFWDDAAEPSVRSQNPPLDSWQGWRDLGFDTGSRWAELGFLNGFRPDAAGAALLEELGVRLWNQRDIGLRADFPFAREDLPVRQIFVRSGETTDGPGRSLLAGESAALSVSYRDAGGYLHSVPSAQITAHSSAPETAGVAGGVLQAKQPGSATVQISANIGGQQHQADYLVRVRAEDAPTFGAAGQQPGLAPGTELTAQSRRSSGVLVLAVYRGTELAGLASRDLGQSGAGETAPVTVPPGATRAVAMVWNNMDEMQPECSPAVLDE